MIDVNLIRATIITLNGIVEQLENGSFELLHGDCNIELVHATVSKPNEQTGWVETKPNGANFVDIDINFAYNKVIVDE